MCSNSYVWCRGQFVFTRRAPFPATPHVGFSARPSWARFGLASSRSGIVSCAFPGPDLPLITARAGPRQLYSPDGASLNHFPFPSHTHTLLLHSIAPGTAHGHGRHRFGPVPLGDDRSHNECYAPFAPHSCLCDGSLSATDLVDVSVNR